MRRIAGLAALAYVAGVGIENMEVLDSPTLGSSVGDILAAYEDETFAIVTHTAGALALVAYVVFVFALFALVRRDSWALAGLVGGVGGPLLAAIGIAASAALIGDPHDSGDTVDTLHELYLRSRMVAGPFMALFLVGMGTAALRARLLPPWLVWLGYAVAVPLVLTPLGGEAHALEVGVGVAFGLDTLWIFVAGLLLALGDDLPLTLFARRAAFLLLAIAAGLVGLGLLAAPGATGKFFAWGLGPEPLAAFAGGVYVGAAVLYAVALRQSWRRVQGLVLGAVVLSVSVLLVTLTHTDQFDFGRLQAWAWVVLFALFSVVTAWLFLAGSDEPTGPPGQPLPGWARALLGVVAVLLGALALALWVDPTGLAGPSPFALPPLGGRFAGSWVALLATLAGWAAVRDDREQAQLPALGLVLLPAGALVAALRTIGDIEPAGAAGGYLAAAAALVAVGAAVALASASASSSATARS